MPAMFEGGNSRPKPTPKGAPSGHPTSRVKPPSVGPRGAPGATGGGRRPSPKPKSSGGGGGSGGRGGSNLGSYGYSGGSVGNSSIGSVAGLAAPAAPSLDEYLGGDSTYQSQLAALAKALTNYKTQMGERQTEYSTDFTGRLNELNKTEERATTDQVDDFAGRGMFISGLYGAERGKLESDFDRRETEMNTTKTAWMNALGRDFLNFNEEQALSKQKARQDAVDRRASQYGL